MVAWTAVAVVAAIAMIDLHIDLDRSLKPETIDNSKQLLPVAESVRFCSLGFDRFLSDVYWLAFIQYLGEDRPKGKGFVSTYDYINLITQLDPYFGKAYWFGSWAIGDWQKRPDLADKIMQRGMAYNPNDWYLPFIAGANQYIFAHDNKKAAAYYRRAARLPGSPEYLVRQADILDSAVPELVKQWHTLNRLYITTNDEQLKASIKPQLVKVLLNMYHEAPTKLIRDMSADRIRGLGVDPDHPEI
jgi:hypothetical protein